MTVVELIRFWLAKQKAKTINQAKQPQFLKICWVLTGFGLTGFQMFQHLFAVLFAGAPEALQLHY